MGDIQSLIDWLNKNGILELSGGVDVDYLADKSGAVGLYKIPEINKESYIDGSELITEHYILLAKKVSGLKGIRLKNVNVFEAFEDWIEQKNMKGELPTFIKGIVNNIELTSPVHLEESEQKNNVYQCTIAITYLKKGK